MEWLESLVALYNGVLYNMPFYLNIFYWQSLPKSNKLLNIKLYHREVIEQSIDWVSV